MQAQDTQSSKKASVLADLDAVRSMIRRHKFNDLVFAGIGLIALMIGLLTLLTLFVDLVMDGYPRFNIQFFSDFPSRRAGSAGLLSAWVGSILVMTVTFLTAVPIGVGAGLYLEEYAPKNWFSDLIEINVSNLAGVPSIIYGLLALGLF
ncbi:MAG: phosphate ABC transporter, permease protein PstA, partial [Sulfuritalea sp.]|nr:phosphate ABC transporter, permease protein PstA [Sulfuritalea sp.]